MWHALRAELTYSRSWLLGGLGIATFVVVLLSVIIRFFEPGEGPPTFVVAMFPFIAGMVVSFIVQAYRIEERRARLLLAGPLTPQHLAGVTVLLPLCLFALSALAAVPMIGLAYLIVGKFEASSFVVTAGFAGQALGVAQLGPLAQESSAAHRQQRSAASLAGWTVFSAAVLVLAASQFFLHTFAGHAGVIMVVVAAMVGAATLYRGRTDFTR